MKTLLLDLDNWDLVIDAFGNLAVADTPYAEAQDAASAIKLFMGEYYYDTTEGVPYWTDILGKSPPINYMRQKFIAAAIGVPNVASAVCYLSAITNRKASGQVQITTLDGQTATASF